MEGSKRDRCIILTTEENGKKQEQKRYYITNIAGGVEEFVREEDIGQ